MSLNIVSKVESAARPVVTGTSVMITSPAETSAIANMPCPPYLHGTVIETWRDREKEESKERRGETRSCSQVEGSQAVWESGGRAAGHSTPYTGESR